MSEAVTLSNAVLKETMTDALVFRGVAPDMNIEVTGSYVVVKETTLNVPSSMYGYGVLEVIKTSSFVLQRYTPHENEAVPSSVGFWTRIKMTTFSPWRRYTPVN